MDLIHFSRDPVATLASMVQPVEPSFKPHGFWVSDESEKDNWSAWCRAEEFHLDRLACRTRVHLVPAHRVLILNTSSEIRRLTDDYGGCPEYMAQMPWPSRQGYAIDWACIAKDYQGIIITPYQWSMRLHEACFWYYGWDCASGCLWDVSCIDQIEQLR